MGDKFQDLYRIDSNRLPDWDYSSDGSYFITICARNHNLYFGELKNKNIHFTDIGKIADKYWLEMPNTYKNLFLDKYVIMPDHVHLLFHIRNSKKSMSGKLQYNSFGSLIKNSVSSIINHYKGKVTKYARKNKIEFVWQSRFDDHVIKSEAELKRIRNYIVKNIQNWNSSNE